MKTCLCVAAILLALALGTGIAVACMWDSDTLRDEQKQHPTLAAAILSPTNDPPDTNALNARLQKLRATPNENDPAWWNDLGGAYLRLGQPAEAVKILEPVTNRFATNYGIHANLGTAYHLLGRYADAEREIARDLEIDPNAHFGLEKYHLALLQYLIRDEDYRWRHVYVDEFTHSFLTQFVHSLRPYYQEEVTNQVPDQTALKQEFEDVKTALTKTNFAGAWKQVENKVEKIASFDARPAYRKQWDLAEDDHLEKGVIYMASLNEKEPACWVMLGMIATQTSDKNLAIAAFEKAIQLGSPQQPILQARVDALREHIHDAGSQSSGIKSGLIIIAVLLVAGLFLVRMLWRGVIRFLFGVRPQGPEAGARQ